MKDDIAAIREALADAALPRQKWVWGTFSGLLVVPLDERGHTNKSDPVCVIPSNDFPHRAEATAKADYIAACHPERIARLLDALEAALIDAASRERIAYAEGRKDQAQACANPLPAAAVQEIWDKCRVLDLDHVAFAWRVQRVCAQARYADGDEVMPSAMATAPDTAQQEKR